MKTAKELELRQKLLKRYSYYTAYCNKIVDNLCHMVLSKEEIEKGKTKSCEELTDFEKHIIEFGFRKKRMSSHVVSGNYYEESIMLNYYYNLYVLTMTKLIEQSLFFSDEHNDIGKDERMKDIDNFIKMFEKVSVTNRHFEGIRPEWNGVCELCRIRDSGMKFLFGEWFSYITLIPITNASTETMLGWMEFADNILKRERKYKPPVPLTPEELAEKRRREREEREREERKQREIEEREKLKKENEKRYYEFEYKRQVKLANLITILFFISIVMLFSYLGWVEEETFDTIRNISVIIAIPLVIAVYYHMYLRKFTPLKNLKKEIKNKEPIHKYTKKEKIFIAGSGLVLLLGVVFNYSFIFFLFVPLIIAYGLYQAYDVSKELDANVLLFEEDLNAKKRIKEAIGEYVYIIYYDSVEVSDRIVDEIYRFFKKDKTQFEISLRTVKDFEYPYDSMDDMSMFMLVDRSKEYAQKERNGFAELQRIKSYCVALKYAKI